MINKQNWPHIYNFRIVLLFKEHVVWKIGRNKCRASIPIANGIVEFAVEDGSIVEMSEVTKMRLDLSFHAEFRFEIVRAGDLDLSRTYHACKQERAYAECFFKHHIRK